MILAISFCIVGSACTNQRLFSALEDRYVYERIDDERQAVRSLIETKTLLSQRQLRIYVVDSFDESIFQCLKENEDIYSISSELVLSCAAKEIVIHIPHAFMKILFHKICFRTFLFLEEIVLSIVNISPPL